MYDGCPFLDMTERDADPQCLLDEKEALEEKLAICGYEFHLAQENISRLKKGLQRKTESSLSESGGILIALLAS